MTEPLMSFVFTPSRTDYIKTIQLFWFRQKEYWPLIGVFGFLSLCVLFSMVSRVIDFNIGLLFPVFILVFYIALIFLIQPLLVGHQVDTNERLRSETKYEITEAGISITDSYTEVKFDWGSFSSFIETKEYFLIIRSVNKRIFQLVPKRAFQTSEQVTRFREILAEQLSKAQSEVKVVPWYIKYRLRIILYSILFVVIVCMVIYNFIDGP